MEHLFPFPRSGHSFLDILKDPFSRNVFGHEEAARDEDRSQFTVAFANRLGLLIHDPANHLSLFKLGYTLLEAFLQSNVTGPPLSFDPEKVIFPILYHDCVADLKKQMFAGLQVQGDTVYPLTPHVELFWAAKSILGNAGFCEGFNGRRARLRVNFWHQKLLSEPNDSLRDLIYQDAEVLEGQLNSRLVFRGAAAERHLVEFLVEKAVTATYYGNGIQARTDLAKAAKVRGFEFVLTGALGKRTKFQDRDISQLVVLAKSTGKDTEEALTREEDQIGSPTQSRRSSPVDLSLGKGGYTESTTPRTDIMSLAVPPPRKPENILLDDDTLLESIHFAPPKLLPQVISEETEPPPSLAGLDPSSQPLLQPFDSIILLQVASSVSNTSPSDGLTREETLPYATRVLEGGSSNWQVYTQALLVRSRIEGYRSRTAQRGLLQLQALVDQVIVEMTASQRSSSAGVSKPDSDKLDSPSSIAKQEPNSSPDVSGPTSFLPAARPSDSAPVAERLRYIYQLHPPFRWELEAELAARWVSMGGLKTALDIYERLQMHAEVALCLAATNNEAKAIRATRKLLFQPRLGEQVEQHGRTGPELDVLPPDAPRLFCILGDLENSAQHYERAWAVSNDRYPRAQRSLGRYHVRAKKYHFAAEAYTKSLKVNGLNAATWFALGCVQLELSDFRGAVESFTRAVQFEADDAEAWSNLAAALLRLADVEAEDGAMSTLSPAELAVQGDEETDETETLPEDVKPAPGPLGRRKQALSALRRAAALKHSDARIWDNYLTVAASIPPPDTPWSEVILAQKRLIEIRGKRVGEKAVDEKILNVLVRYVTQEFVYPVPGSRPSDQSSSSTMAPASSASNLSESTPVPQPFFRPGSTPYQLLDLIDSHVVPLITTSPTLYELLFTFNLWRHRPLAALAAREKAWRAVTSQPGVYDGSEEDWGKVVDATVRLVKAYEELGPKEREEGGSRGEIVARDWRFKAKSAIRGVMGRGRGSWEDGGNDGWERLVPMLDRLQ